MKNLHLWCGFFFMCKKKGFEPHAGALGKKATVLNVQLTPSAREDAKHLRAFGA